MMQCLHVGLNNFLELPKVLPSVISSVLTLQSREQSAKETGTFWDGHNLKKKDARALEEDLLMGSADEFEECGEEYTGPLFAPLREKGGDNNLHRGTAMFTKDCLREESFFGRILSGNTEDCFPVQEPKKARTKSAEALVPTEELLRAAEMGDKDATVTIRAMKKIMKNRATAKTSHIRKAQKYTEMGEMIIKLQNENDMYLAQLVVAQSAADRVNMLEVQNEALRLRLSAFIAAES